MDKLNMLKELWVRLNSASPDFFNKIQKYSVYLGIAIAIPLALEWAEVLVLPGKLSTLLWGGIAFFLGTGSASALPVKSADGPGGDTPPPGPKNPGTP